MLYIHFYFRPAHRAKKPVKQALKVSHCRTLLASFSRWMQECNAGYNAVYRPWVTTQSSRGKVTL